MDARSSFQANGTNNSSGDLVGMQNLTVAAQAVTSLFLIASPLNAALYSYICTVEAVHSPEGEVDAYGTLAQETTVAIDRRTGAIIHPVIGNTTYRTTTVLEYGSEDWSFRVLSESGTASDDPTGGNVVYAEVAEYKEGFRKPFLAVKDGVAYMGYCE